jgi:hypothetical protein
LVGHRGRRPNGLDDKANGAIVFTKLNGAPVAEIDWETVYAAGPRGYSDYPRIRPDAMATASISVA